MPIIFPGEDCEDLDTEETSSRSQPLGTRRDFRQYTFADHILSAKVHTVAPRPGRNTLSSSKIRQASVRFLRRSAERTTNTEQGIANDEVIYESADEHPRSAVYPSHRDGVSLTRPFTVGEATSDRKPRRVSDAVDQSVTRHRWLVRYQTVAT